MSTSQEGLQKSLDALNNYCRKWKLNINYKKTKCMIFSKGSNTGKNINFTINSKKIEISKEFKYLGITIKNINCSFTPTLADLSCKANRTIFALLSKLPFKIAPVKTMIKLFDTCISPILLYGSEVWDPYMNHNCTIWDTTQIEKTHTQFLKRLLGVNRSTTNILVRSELGRHSLQEKIVTRNINYIKYVENKGPHVLVKQAAYYEMLHADERSSLYSLLTKYEENHFNIKLISKPKLRTLIREDFDTQWKTQISESPKADSFSQFKERVKLEDYLVNIKNRKHMVSFTKLRLSDHCLMIEKGRHKHPRIPREQRFCPFCPTSVEDELHFLTQCSAYKNRNELYTIIQNQVPQFVTLNSQAKFIFMMSQENKLLNNKLVYTIHEWLTKRRENASC